MRLAIIVCLAVILVSGGCEVSRDWAQIQAAAQAQADTVSNDNTLSLPPAYISGFEVTLRKDYTVLITGGVANVGGRSVTVSVDNTLTLQNWVAPRMDTPQHYYIYLSKDGVVYVDIVKPKFDSFYGYYCQPDTGWRSIGKLFTKSTNIVYAIKDVGRSGRTVTVAPKDYVGYADYYCDGVSDEILINAAIIYEWSAYQGGTVQLLEGTFNIETSIILTNYSNINIIGIGAGSIIKVSSTFNDINYTAIIAYNSTICFNLSVKNLTIETSLTEAALMSMYFYNVSGGIISNIYCKEPMTGVLINNSYNIIITDNIFDGNLHERIQDVYGIICYSDSIIQNNVVKKLRSVNTVFGIRSSSGAIVSGNLISDLSTSGAVSQCAGISLITVSYTQFNNNRITNCKTTGGGSAYGIRISNGTSNSFTSNYCYNNGSDAGVANTNLNNFSDAGTTTQVHGNSWQALMDAPLPQAAAGVGQFAGAVQYGGTTANVTLPSGGTWVWHLMRFGALATWATTGATGISAGGSVIATLGGTEWGQYWWWRIA